MIAVTARDAGTAAAGVIGISTGIVLVAIAFADFGTLAAMLRDFALTPPTRRELWHLGKVKVTFAVIAAVIAVGASMAFGNKAIVLATAAATIAVPVASVTSTLTALLMTQSRGVPLSLAAILGFVSGSAALVILVLLDAPIWLLSASLPIAKLVELSLLSATVRAEERGGRASDSFTLRWFVKCWPFAVTSYLIVIYQRSNLLLAGAVLGVVAAGSVAQGLSLWSAIALIPSIFSHAAFPDLVRGSRVDPQAVGRRFLSFTTISVLMMLPFAIFLALAPRVLLSLAFGSTSPELEAFMRWCALGLLFVGPNMLIGFYFLAYRQEKLLALLSAVTAAASVAFTVIGAYQAGVPGVGWSVAMSEIATPIVFAFPLIRLQRATHHERSSSFLPA